MKHLRALFLVLFTATAMIITAGAAGASPSYNNSHNNAATCPSGNVASGSYSSLTVKGDCTIPDGAVVTVSKHLFLN